MADYGFVHDGKVFTPNGTQGVPAVANSDRNAAIEAGELARWQEQPTMQLAYYDFRQEHVTHGVGHRQISSLPAYPSTRDSKITTWLGTSLGTIISAKVYRHNLRGRFVSLRVRGTNGAMYYGRASWDNGTCVWLRKTKGGR